MPICGRWTPLPAVPAADMDRVQGVEAAGCWGRSAPTRISQRWRLGPGKSVPPPQLCPRGARRGLGPWMKSQLAGRCSQRARFHLSVSELPHLCPRGLSFPTLQTPAYAGSEFSSSELQCSLSAPLNVPLC